jgi:hypothetical protein
LEEWLGAHCARQYDPISGSQIVISFSPVRYAPPSAMTIRYHIFIKVQKNV